MSVIPALRQMDYREFKSSLYFIENYRSVRAGVETRVRACTHAHACTHTRNMKKILESFRQMDAPI